MNGIGILPGPRISFIDHLVPLCDLMQIPLLVTDQIIKELIELYYPPLEIILAPSEEYVLDSMLENYNLFFYVQFSRLGNQSFCFNEYLCSKKARSVISLHGNPDKFRDIYWLEHLTDEDIVLAYGPDLCDLMQQKGINKKPIICGNYRLEYYKKYKTFFDAKTAFKKEKKTILYAPTWLSEKLEQRKYGSSFFLFHKELFGDVPKNFQLICKPHPFLINTFHNEVEKIKEFYPNVIFIDNYPLIYPLLQNIDIYLGDFSSMGFDFLYFDKPLFFLSSDKQTPLQQCGTCIQNNIYETINNNLDNDLSSSRKALYKYVYGDQKSLSNLKEEICSRLTY